jgi:FkbM family methyltransferase
VVNHIHFKKFKQALLQQAGLVRSLLIYYGIPGRVSRLQRFYAPFIHPGDLCLEVGAHVGNRVLAWRRLGARVVAVEPQPHLARLLQRLYGRSNHVTILPVALGASSGSAVMYIDSGNPTVATLSADWMAAVQQDPSFDGVHWDMAADVPVTTLDALIEQYGVPAFCKIDVEGYELEVLRGLSQALPALSFEYIPAAMDIATGCLERLGQLGRYEFNYFEGETHRWQSPMWLDGRALAVRLLDGKRSGDVVARLKALKE